MSPKRLTFPYTADFVCEADRPTPPSRCVSGRIICQVVPPGSQSHLEFWHAKIWAHNMLICLKTDLLETSRFRGTGTSEVSFITAIPAGLGLASRRPALVTACLVLHNICVDMEDTWHEPVRHPRPTDGPQGHAAGVYFTLPSHACTHAWRTPSPPCHMRVSHCVTGTVPGNPACGPDADRGSGGVPHWWREAPDPKYRWAAGDETATSTAQRERLYKIGSVEIRKKLREHVKTSDKCRRFGGR